jgi:hypothetical protein
MRGRENLKDLGLDGSIILNFVLEELIENIWTGFIWPRLKINGGL